MNQPANLPPWRPLLQAARHREGRSPASRWLQLATVAVDGTPRVRTVVFRGWAGPACLDVLTDGRSDKVVELHQQPALELCWLLPKAQSQFRLRGQVMPVPIDQLQEAREQHWQQLSSQGRALWGWPQPGARRQIDAVFSAELSDQSPMPHHFVLLRIALITVELLELKHHPHRRRRWQMERGWPMEELNP